MSFKDTFFVYLMPFFNMSSDGNSNQSNW